MSIRIITLALAAVALLLGPSAVLAHHGAATFDTVGEITLKGTVTEWVWSNPHSILRIDVKGEDGTVKNWSVATANVADLSKRGWTRKTLNPGDQVTVLDSARQERRTGGDDQKRRAGRRHEAPVAERMPYAHTIDGRSNSRGGGGDLPVQRNGAVRGASRD